MAIEERIIPFDTTYRTPAGSNNIAIFLQNESEYRNTINSFINNNLTNQFSNNKKIIPGELCLTMKNHLKDIDFEVDFEGNLIVHAEDADNYSLDSEGNLIYTYR